MAHHEGEATPIERVLEVLTEHGLEGMAEAIETLMNAAMRIERSEFLRAAPGERSSERIGHANGFPNETSLLRLASALAAEISDDWETGRAYLAPTAEAEKIGSRGCPRNDDLDPARSPRTPARSKTRTRVRRKKTQA